MYNLRTLLPSIVVLLTAVPIINGENNIFKFDVSTNDLTVLVGEGERWIIDQSGTLPNGYNITFIKQHPNLVDVVPPSVFIEPNDNNNSTNSYNITIFGKSPGHLVITSQSQPNETSISSNVFVRVTVANSMVIYYISLVFGWVYFVAWSVSFYPQIYENFRRKSVVGLNFDFLALNIVGFAMYSVFNAGLFWNSDIQAEYFNRYPRGLNPVLINDIFFSFHAMFATLITIGQCFIYERAEQRVSTTARSLLSLFCVVVIILAILAGTNVLHWLDFLYGCSYVKLTITLIKYIPQAVMNYRRKSTVGWSIGNILLDFTGGMLSMLQMILNGYNYDDWDSIFGDPTKFGLGLFSVCFDIFFMLQHYVFYRHATKKLSESQTTTVEDLSSSTMKF
ncbi:unnamed protein product [Hermetia illucens]|uniref:Cystinosin homolog n=1 Tax=Hermetia illucens TaxID=343691 RepID=A0A7R8UQL1_HERIL|nr:cystinosin homolog isoform X3 [Hermetia illucens]CAD7085203.1 unnamed protein product [Hermetia illucens]